MSGDFDFQRLLVIHWGGQYKSFITSYIGILVHGLLYFGFKFVKKTKLIAANEAVIANYVE